ncbi:Trk system potassium transporter TrkA [Corticibacter populi]|uniref:Trk system potassium uptake protein TrkA n=1 Tax=Corticibacter populi TaxID=1550736 RepID=A0A3M6QPF5_9BURK|nr:Trk system potassium transporter TrkA [Corticibacter populi]RMX04895.1 Trk system potassium transporter TrkA [Corticibacter populi]RZS33682.1 trk system potassium uptake protein TrkA [Corticibacter populi]
MKIIILGAGRVGQAVADSLVLERNDITVIDTDRQRLRDLESRYDLRGVLGNGVDPAVLADAGAQDTDLLIACASADETNLVCCKIGHMVFNIPTRIARVRSGAWMEESKLLGPEGFAVDHCLRPEDSLTRYLNLLVEYPQAMQVREFAGGRAMLASVRARAAAPMVSRTIGEVRALMPELPMRIVAIYRRFADQPDRFIQSDGSTRIEPDDEVFVLAAREHIAEVLTLLAKPIEAPAVTVRRIMIVDGGIVALKLAQSLVQQRKGYYRIKVVERDSEVSTGLSATMPDDVLLFNAEGTDEDFLEQESIEEVDLLLALSNDDENNIMTSLLAKRMGAKRVLALINQRSYADLMHGTQVDIALTPAQAMLGELLTFVRQGDVQAVHSLRRGVAEALEIVARGDAKTSRVVGHKVGELKLPRDVHIGLIARGLEPAQPQPGAAGADAAANAAADAAAPPAPDAPASPSTREASALPEMQAAQAAAAAPSPASAPAPAARPAAETEAAAAPPAPDAPREPQVIFPNRDTVIESGDHVVFFLPHKRLVREIEKVFSVKPTFF